MVETRSSSKRASVVSVPGSVSTPSPATTPEITVTPSYRQLRSTRTRTKRRTSIDFTISIDIKKETEEKDRGVDIDLHTLPSYEPRHGSWYSPSAVPRPAIHVQGPLPLAPSAIMTEPMDIDPSSPLAMTIGSTLNGSRTGYAQRRPRQPTLLPHFPGSGSGSGYGQSHPRESRYFPRRRSEAISYPSASTISRRGSTTDNRRPHLNQVQLRDRSEKFQFWRTFFDNPETADVYVQAMSIPPNDNQETRTMGHTMKVRGVANTDRGGERRGDMFWITKIFEADMRGWIPVFGPSADAAPDPGSFYSDVGMDIYAGNGDGTDVGSTLPNGITPHFNAASAFSLAPPSAMGPRNSVSVSPMSMSPHVGPSLRDGLPLSPLSRPATIDVSGTGPVAGGTGISAGVSSPQQPYQVGYPAGRRMSAAPHIHLNYDRPEGDLMKAASLASTNTRKGSVSHAISVASPEEMDGGRRYSSLSGGVVGMNGGWAGRPRLYLLSAVGEIPEPGGRRESLFCGGNEIVEPESMRGSFFDFGVGAGQQGSVAGSGGSGHGGSIPIHVEYARLYLPKLAAFIYSNNVYKGDTLSIPLPHPAVWPQTVAWVYGRGHDLTILPNRYSIYAPDNAAIDHQGPSSRSVSDSPKRKREPDDSDAQGDRCGARRVKRRLRSTQGKYQARGEEDLDLSARVRNQERDEFERGMVRRLVLENVRYLGGDV